jgi:tetratricopeptide (TPR) repeat protein
MHSRNLVKVGLVLGTAIDIMKLGVNPSTKYSQKEDQLLDSLSKELASKCLENRKPTLPSLASIRQYFKRFNYDVFTIALTPTEVNFNYSQIMSNMKQENYQEVLKLCEKEITSSGIQRDRALLLRGTLKLQMTDYVAVMDDFYEVNRLVPSEDNMLLRLDSLIKIAHIRYKFNHMNECYEALDLALEIGTMVRKGYNATIYTFKGNWLEQLKQYEEANLNIKIAVSLDANFYEPCRPVLEVTLNLNEGSLNKEIEDMAIKLIRDFPHNTEGFLAYANLLSTVGRMKEAEEKVDKSIILDPRNPLTYIRSAKIQMNKNSGS